MFHFRAGAINLGMAWAKVEKTYLSLCVSKYSIHLVHHQIFKCNPITAGTFPSILFVHVAHCIREHCDQLGLYFQCSRNMYNAATLPNALDQYIFGPSAATCMS